MTLYQPINERWVEQTGENWSRGELINDGIVQRGVTAEATTRVGRSPLRIVEALHSAHPFNELLRVVITGDACRVSAVPCTNANQVDEAASSQSSA